MHAKDLNIIFLNSFTLNIMHQMDFYFTLCQPDALVLHAAAAAAAAVSSASVLPLTFGTTIWTTILHSMEFLSLPLRTCMLLPSMHAIASELCPGWMDGRKKYPPEAAAVILAAVTTMHRHKMIAINLTFGRWEKKLQAKDMR